MGHSHPGNGVAQLTKRVVAQHPFLLFPAVALLVGAAAIVFERVSGESAAVVLFSGEDAMADVSEQVFLGLVGGVMASHIPHVAQAPAIAVLVGAAVVSVLRLPLASIVLAVLMTRAGVGVTPLIIVGVVVAHIATLMLSSRARRGTQTSAAEPSGREPAAER
jgi:hypothetical protein